MSSREEILDTIGSIYRARVDGDKDAVATYWAPEATFRIAGEPGLLAAIPSGPGLAEATVNELIDRFRFHRAEVVDAVVEGNKAAVHMEVDVSTGGRPVTTQFLDLWEFDGNGKIVSLQQFIDTAMAISLAT